MDQGLGIRVWDLGIRVWDLEFRVYSSGLSGEWGRKERTIT